MKALIRILFSSLIVLILIGSTGCSNLNLGGKTESKADFGWTTPWKFIPGRSGSADDLLAQSKNKIEGDMALETAKPGTLERNFSPISSGIVEIEMRLKMEKQGKVDNLYTDIKYAKKPYVNATKDHRLYIDANETSTIKFYAADEKNRWIFRWHYPFAWWQIGGNYDKPQFYVIDGKGSKKKGMEFTNITAKANHWYKIVSVLDCDTKKWQFWVDGVKFDYPARFNREMSWWQDASEVSKIRFTNCDPGKNWIDSVKIRHNGKLIAASYFDSAGGYEEGKSVIGVE